MELVNQEQIEVGLLTQIATLAVQNKFIEEFISMLSFLNYEGLFWGNGLCDNLRGLAVKYPIIAELTAKVCICHRSLYNLRELNDAMGSDEFHNKCRQFVKEEDHPILTRKWLEEYPQDQEFMES